MNPLRFGMVAGEASGDLLAGLLLEGMRKRWPHLVAQGIGGPKMREQGFDTWWPHDKLAVRGYIEVLKHYREIVGIRKQLARRLEADPPQAFIGVDAPDFNLDLEGQLRQRGVKTVHFVCPSIWAWRAKRVFKLQRCCDHVLCIFPFEPELLAKHGIGATYVGHPLANVIPMEPDRAGARRALGLPQAGEVLAVLPGSRGSEIDYHCPLFFAAAALVKQSRPGIRIVVPAMPAFKAKIERAAREAGLHDALVVEGQSHTVLAACDLTLIASGTATLEAALFKRPMVIAYAVHWITYRLMKPHQVMPWFGLPNILLREFAVPELIQHDAKPPALASALLDWLASPDRMAAVQDKFRGLHLQLQRDTATLATDAIEKVLAG